MTELLNDVYFEEEIARDKNRKALLLAQTRFAVQIKPFIEARPERLEYVENDIHRIIVEASAEVGADESYVEDRLRRYIAEAVAVSEPEHIDLDSDRLDSYPPKKNDPAAVDPEPDALTSVLDYGETVLDDDEPDARIDLGTTTESCYRCKAELNPVVAAASKVCLDCASELAKLADANPLALAPNGVQPGQPVDPNARVTCPYCSAKGYHWEGNQTEYQTHVTQQHQQEMQQAQQTMPTLQAAYPFTDDSTGGQLPGGGTPSTFQRMFDPQMLEQTYFEELMKETSPSTAWMWCQDIANVTGESAESYYQRWQQAHPQSRSGKLRFLAAPEDLSPPAANPDTVQADEGLSEQGNPVHHFDDVIQKLADDAAAIQYSTATDDVINEIAQRYGVDPKTVKDKIFVTAEFGQSKGMNGSAADSIEPPNGYTQVDMQGEDQSGSGQVQTHDAMVPYELARDKVAKDLSMQPDLIDSMLKDAYGDNLGDEYHASVSGQQSYYLPQDMVGAQQEQEQQQPQQNQQVGPTPQPTQQAQPLAPQPTSSVVRVSLADLLEADRRRRR